jgi:SAM-dependent methyltransferase
MLTVDYRVLDVRNGHRVLDIGCGAGRHSFEALTRGARVVSADLDDVALKEVAQMGAAMVAEDQAPLGATLNCTRADALELPFADASFERIIASEVMEHIPDDESALHELHRVLKPNGILAVTVPRRWPEQICWLLSNDYHSAAGGHVRIYTRDDLESKLQRADLYPFRHHYAHALHSPYWWLKCAIGVDRDLPITRAYHSFLVWDIMRKPRLVRTTERALDPVLGKSMVVYARKVA